MAKYKRADLAEEEDSVHVNTDNNHSKTHVLPIQPPGIWKSRSQLEKILLSFSLLTFVTMCISFACVVRGYRSWYILHVDPQSSGKYQFTFSLNSNHLLLILIWKVIVFHSTYIE